jgi:hypothetical protein
MKLSQAIALHLGELDQPVISNYELDMFIFNALFEKKFKKLPIEFTYHFRTKNQINDELKAIVSFGVIIPHNDFPEGKVFQIVGKKGFDLGDIACSVDPFAYISHLSAMAFHGITNRIPNTLYISTPPPQKWAVFALMKMKKDCQGSLKEYFDKGFSRLTRIKFDKFNRNPVVRYSSIHWGAFKTIKDRKIRVSTIGRTFLDMVREPNYCGGIRHVIEVFKEFGSPYKKLIIDEVDRHGNQIEKIRVGYLLEEVCNIRDNIIENWANFTQRGGSRKLDPTGEFSSTYSERWSLSLNVE